MFDDKYALFSGKLGDVLFVLHSWKKKQKKCFEKFQVFKKFIFS